MQFLGKNPTVVCDTAHNTEGLTIVVDQIKEAGIYGNLHLVNWIC